MPHRVSRLVTIALSIVFAWCIPFITSASTVERIWLSHQTTDASAVVVSWETSSPTPSKVRYQAGNLTGEVIAATTPTTLHHVEIPIALPDETYTYSIIGDNDAVAVQGQFKSLPTKGELRVVIVGDWGYAMGKDYSALRKEDPHLLLTAGDNVPSLHDAKALGLKAFSALIDQAPELFRTVPFMPILGNHDREIRPRGPKPPVEPVYDVEAQTYREFFALPGVEWRWHFDVSAFDLRFIALDLNHISDFGTTWQTCHAWDEASEQFQWYKKLMADTKAGYVFTLNNERHSSFLGKTKGLWHEQFRKGSALVTGFGYFAERAELEGGLPYFNTCLKGDGSPYKDPKSAFFASTDNYLLLTFTAGSPTMKVQLKNLKGEALDTRKITRRPGA